MTNHVHLIAAPFTGDSLASAQLAGANDQRVKVQCLLERAGDRRKFLAPFSDANAEIFRCHEKAERPFRW